MKIAIAASGNDVTSLVDSHFGRCEWFCIFNTNSRQIKFIENPAALYTDKAGVKAVDFLLETGVCIAIAGRFGAKVVEAFRANKVQMIVPEEEKTINDIINQIK